jgi:thimet oligopeptidase
MKIYQQYFVLCLIIMPSCITNTQEKATTEAIKAHDTRMSMDVNSLEKLAIVYPKSVDEIKQWTDAAIALVQHECATIIALQDQDRTFDNTMHALDISYNKVKTFMSLLGMLEYVHPDSAIREAIHTATTTLTDVLIDLFMDPALYQAVQNYYDHNHQHETLSTVDELLLTDFLKSCKRLGLHLPQSVLDQIKTISKELAAMEQDFIVNISNDNSTITVTRDELQGLSDDFIDHLQQDGDSYIVPCNHVYYVPVMTQCSVGQTRKKLYFARNNEVYPTNDTLLVSILTKRQQLATLLGHKSFASVDLEQTSAKNVETVDQFLRQLAHVTSQKATQECALLKTDLPEGIQLQADGCFNAWDYPYVDAQYNKKHFSIDESAIAQYLPVEKVIDGIFHIYQDLLGLIFKKVTPVWSWHEDVYLIEIYRQSSQKLSTQELLGYLFLDLYPRPNKYSHACVAPQFYSYNLAGKNSTSIATLIVNVPQPSGDKPALLRHSDAVTFFHEFGHAMHHVLGRTQHPGQSGTNVAVDFVETPSQMFEQWMFEPAMLAQVSGHYQTNEPLPADIINKKIKLRQANAGYMCLRQCMIALFALHSMTDNDLSYNPAALWKSLHEKYSASLIGYEENNHWYTTFGHLASDLYASKYYGYLWTEVFALDLFSEIKKHEFSPEYSAKVIQLLSAGGSVDAQILLHDFLGREPNQNAFLTKLGLQ